MPPETGRQTYPLKLLFIFFVLSAGIMISGYLFYLQQKGSVKEEAGKNLSAIAKLKVKEIVHWKRERLGDASVLVDNPLIVEAVRKISKRKSGQQTRQALLSVMESLKKHSGYEGIYLLDLKGKPVVSTSGSRQETGKYAVKLAAESMKTGRIIFSELHTRHDLHDIHIDMIAPVVVTKGRAQAYGCFLFCIDPSEFLFPLIQSWPVPSKTAETLLIRKDGSEVLFLNELRHKKDTAMNLRIPLGRDDLPAAMAIKGMTGIVEGKDYRNIPVLAAIRAVPGTPWFIVSKVDKTEVFGPLEKRGALIAFIVAVLIFASGLGILLLWKHQSVQFFRKQYKIEHERQLYAQRYEHLTRYANDIILLAEKDGKIIDVNERAVQMYGYDRNTILSLNLCDLRSPSTKMLLNGQLKEIEAHNGLIFETEHQKADETVFPVEESSRIIAIDGRQYYQSIVRDVTERKKAEEALRASEDHYHSLFEGMLNGYAYCRMIYEDGDPQDFVYLDVNPAFERLTGLKDVVGRKASDVIPGIRQADPELFEIYGRVALTGTPERFEMYVESLDMWFWLSVYSQQKEHFVAVFDVITERKKAEQALREGEEQLRAMFDVASIGIAQADIRTGQWIRVNQKMCEISGYSADEMLRMRIPEITHPEDRQRDWEAFQRVVNGEAPDYRLEKRYIRKDGSLVWVNVNMTVLRDADGKPVRTMATIEDITERKNAEEEIRKLNEELEQRVHDRTSQLEAANKELEAFAYSVSHDLRAPLRAIDGFSRFVLEDYAEKLDDEGRRLLNIIRQNTQKMDELITDILALSRVSRTEMSFSRIDMTALVNAVYHELASPEVQEKFVFSTSPLPDAFGDPVLIHQVWINLISNAIKYTMPREERRIAIEGRTENNMNIYSVKDTGVGFNPDYTRKLFGVFQRLHKAEEFEGTGVGLAIVQRIILRHGGEVRAEGKVNEGATFFFTIPTKEGNSEQAKGTSE